MLCKKITIPLECIAPGAGFVLRFWVKLVCEVLENDTLLLTLTVPVELMYRLMCVCTNADARQCAYLLILVCIYGDYMPFSFLPSPPNLVMSLQNVQFPQSSLLHPSQVPHLLLFLKTLLHVCACGCGCTIVFTFIVVLHLVELHDFVLASFVSFPCCACRECAHQKCESVIKFQAYTGCTCILGRWLITYILHIRPQCFLLLFSWMSVYSVFIMCVTIISN